MLARMATNGGGADDGAIRGAKSPPKKQTIEKTYQKKSQLEHILLRPDTYIGSVEKTTELMWIYDNQSEKMIQKQIEYVPGLYKIFDEILVNAADNKQRDKKMDCLKIEIDAETNQISVWNNGQGIPVVMHKDEKMYVPTMIFGHLLTSSNYNDEEEKVTGGRNGYGAKLCNIFSSKFTVETAAKQYKSQFKQTWGSNMSKASEAKIKEFFGEDFTKITFSPDLPKFKMDKLDDDIVGLMSRRAFDVAASTRGVKVFLNGKRVPIKNFKDYIDLYVKGGEDENNEALKVVYENPNERWEVGLTISDKGFQQMSFVNSIATTKGGKHVDYVVDMIVKQLLEVLKKRNKGGVNIKPFQVKNHMWVFVNCLIVNPTFDSQTKEMMTLQMKSFGSKCNLSEKFINQVTKSGIVESVLTWAKFKAQTELNKAGGKKQSKLKGIPKLEDANEAGTRNSLKCTLILTEGDSAKTVAVSGLGVIGRDFYGVFPLKGKLLNVREATHKQILENQEINNLIKIIGLQYKKKYNSDDDMKTLRYGKIMIMTDQDQDGSHIKGLLINFIHYNWPELLRRDFLEEFITPIVKATKRNEELSFYSLPEFEEWKKSTPNQHTYNIKYYKGLGTSTSKEAKEYFTNMARHRILFQYKGQQDDDHIVLAFSKKHIEHRKEWLTNFMTESKRCKEMGEPEKYLYCKNTKAVSYTEFVNLELVLFSNADNIRSIPCLVDGFKPGQRKVMFTCFKRNDKREVKVAQLSGSVAEMSAYHHGEQSLCMTIVNLAQNYVGSNNINLLQPKGQFGTRLTGGKDAASPRYIFTKMSPLTRLLFHPQDDPLLKYEYDDNQKIEPTWYIPILPMILVNGADGIGTGWMTKIPNYSPRDIVANLRLMLTGEQPRTMTPWYKNFRGTIEDGGDQRYVISGEIAIVGDDMLEITELPIGTWTQTYKENVLEPLLHGSEKIKATIADYKEYNTDTTIKFLITCLPGQLRNMEKDGLHKVFKLQSIVSISSMCCFDDLGCLRRFDSVLDIVREFYTLRLTMYQKRKDYIEGMLEAEADKLSNQARFIMEKCSGDLVVENKKRKTIVDELIKRGYSPDPMKEWKRRVKIEEDEPAEQEEEEEENDDDGGVGKARPAKKAPVDPEKAFKNLTEVKKYDYLLGMSMWMLTDERKNELLKQRDQKLIELDIMKKRTKSDLWLEDLDEFMQKLDEVEEKERKDEAGEISKVKKATGKKKIHIIETMPSPKGRRIAPTISEELKKKIIVASRARENKTKKGIKKDTSLDTQEEGDEFDAMVQNKKTLKDKLGTPEEIEKKAKGKKPKDGLKQTKLNFKKVPEKITNGSPKGKKKTRKIDSDDEDKMSIESGSDIEFSNVDVEVKTRTTSRRAATKPGRYKIDDDDDDDEIEHILSDGSGDLFDNDAVKEASVRQEVILASDSDNDGPPPRHETSEDMFDSLVGRKRDSSSSPLPPPSSNTAAAPSNKKQFIDISDGDNEVVKKSKPKNKKPTEDGDGVVNKKSKAKKKPMNNDFNSDSDFEDTTKAKAPPKRKKKESDDDFDLPPKKAKKSSKKKKIASDSDSDEGGISSRPIATGRVGRNAQKSKYVYDDYSDLSD